MARMICLANSFRPGGRCVAGIDVETGRWIRPVPPGGGAIPTQQTMLNRQELSVLDVVELEVERPSFDTRYQRENCVMPNWDWHIVGKATPQHVLPYCDDAAPILFNASDRVAPQQLEQLPAQEWKSLQLVRLRRLSFQRDDYKPGQWRAVFQDARGNVYNLKVTDVTTCGRLGQGERVGPECLLSVSLAEPWTPDGLKPEMCYKVVAAVIEL